MSADQTYLFAFFLVFLRGSAMLMTAPVFGSATLPVMIRVMVAFTISAALAAVMANHGPKPPENLFDLGAACLSELVAGVLLGSFVSLGITAAQIAGAIMDQQMGLSAAQVLNPVNGVSVTVLSQFKSMLAVVVLLCANGHHLMLQAFVASYRPMPTIDMQSISLNFASLVGDVCVLGIQIALPILGIGLIVDAALGLLSKAAPQMQVYVVGVPIKVLAGILAISIALPAFVAAVSSIVSVAIDRFGGALKLG